MSPGPAGSALHSAMQWGGSLKAQCFTSPCPPCIIAQRAESTSELAKATLEVLADPQLAPIFLDVAGIQIEEHFPRIISYWEKLLLGKTDYQRHTMNIHREVDAQQQFTSEDFVRWYALFEATANQSFAGDKTERAKRVAKKIANNMAQSLGLEKPLG